MTKSDKKIVSRVHSLIVGISGYMENFCRDSLDSSKTYIYMSSEDKSKLDSDLMRARILLEELFVEQRNLFSTYV